MKHREILGYCFFAACLNLGIASALEPLPEIKPLFETADSWPLGKYWTGKNIGPKDFYLAEQGNYNRTTEESSRPYYETGLFPRMIPGHWRLSVFSKAARLMPWEQKCVEMFLQNKWPLFSINYIQMQGGEVPSPETLAKVDDIWIGDGQPEEPVYRLEPVFHYLATGEKWKGSSMQHWHDAQALDYFKNHLLPRLEREIPGCTSPDFQWTHKSLKQLSDIYCETYLSKSIRPIAWTMYLSPHMIAEMPNVVTVASKGGDPFLLALQRGSARQSGGGKFLLSWRGHEPTERYSYRKYSSPDRENWGYPLPHMNYYIFRPYLLGQNYYINEGFPTSLVHDMDGNETFQLTALGRIVHELLDYVNRQPERGTVYTPVALVYGRDRWWKEERWYAGKIKFDNADWMNYALMNDLLLPEHRHTKGGGRYSVTAPFGEIMDILQPNPDKPVDPKIFDGYKVLILMGGITLSDQYKTVLENYVHDGGILVVNATDIKDQLDRRFTGVAVGESFQSTEVANNITGEIFSENKFNCFRLVPDSGVETLYSSRGNPVVTANPYGKGKVIITAPEYMLSIEQQTTIKRHRPQTRPHLLAFWSNFFDSLFAAVSPFEVRVRPEDKPDISWSICKKDDSWTLALYNYSLKREELVHETRGTGYVAANYPYKEVPVEIICRFAAEDAVELFEGRDVKIEKNNKGQTVVRTTIRGGDLRIYEFATKRIILPKFTRRVNLALNKPVTSSSASKGYSAEYAVDGKENNGSFWQSQRKGRTFTMPQWLVVDLQAIETISHVKLLFHVWPDRDLDIRQSVYKYQVQVSADGRDWETVIDESKNESPAHPNGTETWFSPVQARYVRLMVLSNSANAGAQVVEFAITGNKTEEHAPRRKFARLQLTQLLPEHISSASAKKKVYLTGQTPLSVNPGWLPAHKQWDELNGWVKLLGKESESIECQESIYAQSVFEAEYLVPTEAKYFAAICGFGVRCRRASVEFKVYVDDLLKFDSGIYRAGRMPLPVVIDIEGASRIKLVTTDADDGIYNDYAWWGDARFILK